MSTIRFAHQREGWDIGEEVTKTSIELLTEAGPDQRFAKVLTDGRIFESTNKALADYFGRITKAHPNQVIRAVRVSLNDYFKRLGIGVMSCSVEPMNSGDDVLKLTDELKSPTVVVIPENAERGTAPLVVGFPVDEGWEELTALTRNLCLRAYSPGEPAGYQQVPLRPLEQCIVVPQGRCVAVRVPLYNSALLAASRFDRNVLPLTTDEDALGKRRVDLEPGQVYLCRYLTREAVVRV